jgi:hypothetical protein
MYDSYRTNSVRVTFLCFFTLSGTKCANVSGFTVQVCTQFLVYEHLDELWLLQHVCWHTIMFCCNSFIVCSFNFYFSYFVELNYIEWVSVQHSTHPEQIVNKMVQVKRRPMTPLCWSKVEI